MNERGPEDRSLPRRLVDAAERHPDKGLTLFDGRGREVGRRSYAELLRRASEVGGRLRALGVGPGQPVVICLPTAFEWFDAWFGALMAGALPVAAAPGTTLGASAIQARRLSAVLDRLSAEVVICRDDQTSSLAGVRALSPEEIERVPNASPPALEGAGEETAFLQLTSGSSGLPRAVCISHRAALHNTWAIDEVIGAPFGLPAHRVFDAYVSWLPLYHDMGLVSSLYLMLVGIDLWLFPPQAFLRRPRYWLDRLGSGVTTHTTCPNFGYQLATDRESASDLAGLDLSNCKAALIGAEMVRPETLAGFAERFAEQGFDARAYRPCYGMAEGTVAITMDRSGQGLRTRPVPAGAAQGLGLAQVVSTGPPLADTEVRVVAPDGTPRQEGAVGEIQVRGAGLFSGYYRDPEATAEVFTGGWLRTGDQGFLAAGELYVTGRLKELLIVRGQNLMPHELEWLAEQEGGTAAGCRAAAFSVARGARGEEVVLVLEVVDRSAELLQGLSEAVSTRIGRELGLPLADLVLVRRGEIPRTTSGKMRRKELRGDYLEGRLNRLC
jgi:acyl-CoA synthetase (AMP-forming)/AMP-acid ligase II